MTEVDWGWKLREAVDRIKTAYAHIGRSSGAPILAIVYPPEQEIAVLKEWHTLMASLAGSFDVRTIDALEATMRVVDEFGVDTIVSNFDEPMPGSDPQAELGHRWVDRIAEQIHALSSRSGDGASAVGHCRATRSPVSSCWSARCYASRLGHREGIPRHSRSLSDPRYAASAPRLLVC